MADFKFSCPHCAISVECDELWCGHEIQCPSCQKEFVVPPKPDAPPHATFAKAAQGPSRLSIGQSRTHHATAPKAVAPQVAALEQKLSQAKAGQKGSAMKWVTAGIVVVVLGVGGYFGYPFVKEWQAKRAETAQQASAPPPDTNTAPAEPQPPPPPKELPLLPAVWTLDVAEAKIPEGKANGMISGTNFVVESAVCTPQVLRLYQGPAVSPEREILVYLRLSAGESLTNHTWTVAKDSRAKDISQVVKRWKTNPRYGPQTRGYSSGYALKLELGDLVSNTLPGRIFLALPDTEQSVVAGHFNAVTSLAPAGESGSPSPVPPPGAPPAAEGGAFQERYGRPR